jgi:hypothetical protein
MKKFTLLLLLLNAAVYAAPPPMPGNLSDMPLSIPTDSRCTVSAGGGQADFGSLSRWQLQPAAEGGDRLSLGKRTVNVSVTCPFSRTMTLMVSGDSTISGGFRYGQNGELRVVVKEARLDGQPVQIKMQTTGRAEQPGELALKANATLSVVSQGGAAIKGKSLTLQLETEPVLRETDARVAQRQNLESRFSINLSD